MRHRDAGGVVTHADTPPPPMRAGAPESREPSRTDRDAPPTTVDVIRNPSDPAIEEIQELGGYRCHDDPAFVRLQADARIEPVAFVQRRAGNLVAGAVGFMHHGRLLQHLRFPTSPAAAAGPDRDRFWSGVREWCRSERIARLILESFEADPYPTPSLGRVREVRQRREYVLDTATEPEALARAFSSNHRRNIAKARKAGLRCYVRTSAEAAADHILAVEASMGRRSAGVPAHAAARLFRGALESGAGECVQVEADGDVLCSLLILATSHRAYYHSGGSLRAGRAVGASHLAMWYAIERSHARGVQTFNLGGTSSGDGDGLARFKEGFATDPVDLEYRVIDLDLPFPLGILRKLKN